MTNLSDDDIFVKMASEFIDVANKYGHEVDQQLVGAALSHAAARYNAFVCSTKVEDAAHMEDIRDDVTRHHVDAFREAFGHHYDDHLKGLAKRA